MLLVVILAFTVSLGLATLVGLAFGASVGASIAVGLVAIVSFLGVLTAVMEQDKVRIRSARSRE